MPVPHNAAELARLLSDIATLRRRCLALAMLDIDIDPDAVGTVFS